MALTAIQLYRDVLPRTNCGACGFATCLAFATQVVLVKLPLKGCPHLDPAALEARQRELDAQHLTGRHLAKDLAADALAWARSRAASLRPADLAERIGGKVEPGEGGDTLLLAYFTDTIHITPAGLRRADGRELGRWEQVFLYNHLAQGGRAQPAGVWRGLEQLPHALPKVRALQEHVEQPLATRFAGRGAELLALARTLGGDGETGERFAADLAVVLHPLPRVPVLLLFWDQEPGEGFPARVKLMFDRTVPEHLDLESILFLSERIRQLLLGEGP